MPANTHSLDLELGSSQYASRADTASLSITGDMSIAGWVRFESALATDTMYAMVGKNNSNTNNRGFVFGLDDAGGTETLKLIISTNGTASSVASVAWTVSTATWYHIVVVYDASEGTADFYVDGVQQGTQQSGLVTSQFDNTYDFAIGRAGLDSGGSGFGYFDGLIDEVVITSDLLTTGEITSLYNGSDASDLLDNIVGYWKLNNDYLDETANNNDLTATGSPVFSTTVPFANYAEVSRFLNMTSKHW